MISGESWTNTEPTPRVTDNPTASDVRGNSVGIAAADAVMRRLGLSSLALHNGGARPVEFASTRRHRTRYRCTVGSASSSWRSMLYTTPSVKIADERTRGILTVLTNSPSGENTS